MKHPCKVKITKFEVTPRSDCCWERYAGVAILVDGSRTPAALTPNPNIEKTKGSCFIDIFINFLSLKKSSSKG